MKNHLKSYLFFITETYILEKPMISETTYMTFYIMLSAYYI
jgi:hypothetical protein